MFRRWIGPAATLAILAGVAAVLLFNLETDVLPSRANNRAGSKFSRGDGTKPTEPPNAVGAAREYPIGDPVEQNQIRVAAVWLPSAEVEGLDAVAGAGADLIHLEADIHSLENNRNGFAKDEFVPYLTIHYTITPLSGKGERLEGALMPMIARDGLHYGANIIMPNRGRFELAYHIEPPSSGGLGRHIDPQLGVAPWWRPFDATFEWDYPGPKGVKVGPEKPGGEH